LTVERPALIWGLRLALRSGCTTVFVQGKERRALGRVTRFLGARLGMIVKFVSDERERE
jgi:hypothetical protein